MTEERREKLHFLYLNMGHFLDHLFMLIFATAAALVLVNDWGMSYSELIPYATPGFIAFAAFTIPAGWLADRWSRESMMCVFFVGIGASSMLTSLAQSPLQIATGLFAIGLFASIYHPVGIAMVLEGQKKTGLRVASNGVWGNMGVAVAALLTGWLIDHSGWRAAFVAPGLFSVLLGLSYIRWVRHFSPSRPMPARPSPGSPPQNRASVTAAPELKKLLIRVLPIVLITTACGGVVFQSTTFALPRVLLEKGGDSALTASMLGWIAFVIFAIGSAGQLVVGYLVDRGRIRNVFVGVALLQILFFFVTSGVEGVWVPFLAAGFMLAAFGQIPINDVLVGKVASSEWRSRILALRYSLTLSAMALSVPLIAWIAANHGLSHLFLVLGSLAVVIMLAAAFLPENV